MSKKEESKQDNMQSSAENKFVASDAGVAPRNDGMKYDPIRGTDVPTHYPAAVVINDGEGEMVKNPTVTPATHNDKINPQDAKTTDSEFIVRAPDTETANKLAEDRSGLPTPDKDVTRSGDK